MRGGEREGGEGEKGEGRGRGWKMVEEGGRGWNQERKIPVSFFFFFLVGVVVVVVDELCCCSSSSSSTTTRFSVFLRSGMLSGIVSSSVANRPGIEGGSSIYVLIG